MKASPVQPVMCFPCVSCHRDADTRQLVYVAELRFESRAGDGRGTAGRTRHERKASAFDELAAKVRRLPELVDAFNIVIGSQEFADAEQAAQAVLRELPVCEQPPVALPPSQ